MMAKEVCHVFQYSFIQYCRESTVDDVTSDIGELNLGETG